MSVTHSEQMAVKQIRDLSHRGIHLKNLTEPLLNIDISTPIG